MTVQWGNLTADLLQIFGPLIAAVLTAFVSWGIAKVAPSLANIMKQNHIDALLYRALSAAVAKTEGAVKGKEVSVPIANSILAKALDYLQAQAPELITKYGPRIEQMLVARLDEHVTLPPEANAETLGVSKP